MFQDVSQFHFLEDCEFLFCIPVLVHLCVVEVGGQGFEDSLTFLVKWAFLFVQKV